MVDYVKSLDDSRPGTNGVNLFMAFAPDVRMMKNAPLGVSAETGINTLMEKLAEAGESSAITSDVVTERVDEALSMLDVAGYNYGEARYTMDLQRHPQRLVLGTESNLLDIEGTWDLVTASPRVLGDFTWTAWDYIGEVGITRPRDEAAGFLGPYPWRLAAVGDIDLIGHRRPLSYYRETVWGLRQRPFIAVHRPDSAGPRGSGYAWSDSIDSWSWPGFEGKPVTVDVYTDADEVELRCNDRAVARVAVGKHRRYIASFEIPYEAGELSAVALRAGREVGRAVLRTAGSDVTLQVTPVRDAIRAGPADLAFLDIALADPTGTVHVTVDRRITITMSGCGVLQGLGSADPCSTNNYTDNTCSTFGGRALAVVRPIDVGEIRVAAETAGCEPVSVTITASR
jgi:hypothetical protein